MGRRGKKLNTKGGKRGQRCQTDRPSRKGCGNFGGRAQGNFSVHSPTNEVKVSRSKRKGGQSIEGKKDKIASLKEEGQERCIVHGGCQKKGGRVTVLVDGKERKRGDEDGQNFNGRLETTSDEKCRKKKDRFTKVVVT